MAAITLLVNGTRHAVDVEPSTPLLYVLRNDLDLSGPRFGCGLGQCGACTVLIKGEAVRSCVRPVSQAQNVEITTLEGLAQDGKLHPVQEAFHLAHGLQCGFCTPGMVLATVSLLGEHPDPSEEEIRHALEGNLCRCTGYQNIVKAVQAAATA